MSVWLCLKLILHNVPFYNSNLQLTLAKDIVNVYRVSKGESMTGYVVQEVAGKNILSAEKYGDLELLLPEGSQLVLSTAPTVRRLKTKPKDFSDDDYLLFSWPFSDPSICFSYYCDIFLYVRRRLKTILLLLK